MAMRSPDAQSQPPGPDRGTVTVVWPDGQRHQVPIGSAWLTAARSAGWLITTGCLGGSCGACEIEVNGQVVRACVATVPASRRGQLMVELASDPYW
jgi:ferredoxin